MKAKQLSKETRLPLHPDRGLWPNRTTSHERNGTSNLLLCFAPKPGVMSR